MSTVGKVIITTIIVVVVAAGGWWLISSMSTNGNKSQQTNGQNESSEPPQDQEIAATITYNGNEFSPASTTINVGETVKIVNDSDNVLFFASDEHPTHQDNSELNVGDIEPGSSATVTITATGTWGYHDHYNASAGGEIIVE
jgi:plastocyanin